MLIGQYFFQSKSLDTSVLFSPASMALDDSFLATGPSPVKVETRVQNQCDSQNQQQPALSWYYSRTTRL